MNLTYVSRAAVALLALVALSTRADARQATIQTLGPLPPGFSQISTDVRVSGDGQVVVGTVFGGSPQEAFRWTLASGLVPLGGAPGGFSTSSAECVSFDGNVIGGSVTNNTLGVSHAMRWTATGGMQSLGRLPGGSSGGFARLTATSDDGSVMVGSSGWFSGGSNFGQEAIKWTQAGGMVSLGDLPGAIYYSYATGVSGSGAAIVGVGTSSNVSGPYGEGFIISGPGPMAPMGALNSTPFDSEPDAVSADGSVVVGSVISPGTTSSVRVPFRYTAATGFQILRPSDPFYNIGWARATNADGSVVVGYIANSSTSNSSRAFVWTQSAGVRLLETLLAEQGADLSGWQFISEATSVSADGLTIVGVGRRTSNPSVSEPFYARLTSLPCPGRWSRVAPPTGPSARSGYAMAFDTARNVLVLFGGDTSGGLSRETWEWNGVSWTLRSVVGPSAREHASAVFDQARSKVVLFGGYNGVSTAYDDTWEWDGAAWTLRSPPARPSPRAIASVAWDSARQRVVLFGGMTGGGSDLGDTWEYDGTTWTQRATSGPSPRRFAGMAYHAQDQRTVLFGGSSSGVGHNDTWEWDGVAGTWTFTNTPGPSKRSLRDLAYDASRGVIVCFSGFGDGQYRADHWEYDGTNWSVRAVALPTLRSSCTTVYDPVGERVLVFGGFGEEGRLGDLWSFDGTKWLPVGGPQVPRYRANGLLTGAPGGLGLLLYGGTSDTPATTAMNDTWLHVGGVWGQLRPVNSPSAGVYAMAACERLVSGQVRPFFFGGINASQDAQRNAYEFDGSSWLATSINIGPSARHSARAAFDSTNARSLVFGGRTGNTPLGDLWEWQLSQWWSLSASGPSPRRDHAMAYDSARQRVVLFGGFANSAGFDDTWEFNVTNNTWTQRTDLAVKPPLRWAARMVYDAARQRVVMFGGYSGSTALNDVWEFDGVAWRQTSNDAGPADRFDAMMAFDPTRQRIVLFGGYNGSLFDDTWVYNGPPVVSINFTAAPPARTHTYVAASVTLSVQAEAADNLPVSYEWWFEPDAHVPTLPAGRLTEGARAGRVTGGGTSTLTIANIQPADTGWYVVRVMRGCDVLATSRHGVGVKCNAADVNYIGGGVEQVEAAYFPPDMQLSLDDILAFIDLYIVSEFCPGAAPCSATDITDLGNSGAGPDGLLTLDDIILFIDSFNEGC